MGIMDDLKKQASNITKEISNQTKKVSRKINRGIDDIIEPPSTLEKMGRVFEDLWKDTIKPEIGKIDATYRYEMDKVYKQMGDTINSNKTASAISDKIGEISKTVSTNSVVKSFGNFCKKLGELIKSLAGTSKDREQAWKNVKTAATEVGTTIKKAVNKEKSSSLSR